MIGGPPEMYAYAPDAQPTNWNDLYELEYFTDKRGDWRWRVRSKVNGQIVVPPHPYTRKVDMEAVVSKLFPLAEPPKYKRPPLGHFPVCLTRAAIPRGQGRISPLGIL